MQDPAPAHPGHDAASWLSLWAFALAFLTIAVVIVGTVPGLLW